MSVPFSSSINVGTTLLAFNFDLDLEHSLTMDNSGACQFRPQFHTSTGMLGGGKGSSANARYAGMYQMMSSVSGASGSSFSITQHHAAQTFTFQVSNESQFCGRITQMSQLGIEVYQPTGTNVESTTAIPAATTLRVHGLLFYDGGKWKLIASTIPSS